MEFDEAKKMNKFIEDRFDFKLNIIEKKVLAFAFMVYHELQVNPVSMGQIHVILNNTDDQGRVLINKVRDITDVEPHVAKRNFDIASFFLDDYYEGMVKNSMSKSSYDCCGNLRAAVDLYVAEHVGEYE